MSRLDANHRRTPAAAIRLSTRNDLPARVLTHLQSILDLCNSTFTPLLDKVLNECEQQLFHIAEKSVHSHQQEHALEGLREIKRKRADMTPVLIQMIEDSLARFDRSSSAPIDAENVRGSRIKPELSLVENSELEPSLALQEIEARHAIRHSQQLHALGYRFGVLAASAAFDTESLPIGPANLCTALRTCCAGMNLTTDYRVMLYRTFDHFAMSEIDVLYRLINQTLAKNGILPHLRINRQMPRALAGHSGDSATAAAAFDEPIKAEAAATSATENPAAVNAPVAAAAALNEAVATAANNLPTTHPEGDLLASVRELLASRRVPARLLPGRADGRPVPIVSLDDLQSALLGPQADFSQMVSGQDAGTNRSFGPHSTTSLPKTADQIRHAMQRRSHQIDPYAPLPQLAPEHTDTIDLIDLLMQQVKQTLPRHVNARGLIDQLHAPMLRVALSDEGFFTQREHPARLLLNTLVDASLHWRDENGVDPDPLLAEKIQWVLHHLNAEAQPTPGFLNQLHEDITRHLQTLERKAEIAERRAIDASQGHERVESARRLATSAIAERIARHASPPKLLLTLLEQPWTDALTLTLLRQGKDSEEYVRRLHIAESLLDSTIPGAPPPPTAMRAEIESGLSQVGIYAEDIQAISARLFTHRSTTSVDEIDAATAQVLTEKLEVAAQSIKKGIATRPIVAAAAEAKIAVVPLNAIERQILSHLKTLPFGTWFDFVTNQQGDTVRRKLAWYSTVSGNCLFVNARGVRTGERSFEQVARDMARDQIRLFRPARESLIDRALKSVWDTLRQLGGRKTPTPPRTPA
jgi:hypothetical protein